MHPLLVISPYISGTRPSGSIWHAPLRRLDRENAQPRQHKGRHLPSIIVLLSMIDSKACSPRWEWVQSKKASAPLIGPSQSSQLPAERRPGLQGQPQGEHAEGGQAVTESCQGERADSLGKGPQVEDVRGRPEHGDKDLSGLRRLAGLSPRNSPEGAAQNLAT